MNKSEENTVRCHLQLKKTAGFMRQVAGKLEMLARAMTILGIGAGEGVGAIGTQMRTRAKDIDLMLANIVSGDGK